MDIRTFLQQYSVDLVLIASAALLLVLYFAAYARSLRPREGTLEWIAMYDHPPFSLTGAAGLAWRDGANAVLAGLCGVAVLLLRYCILLQTLPIHITDIISSRYFIGEMIAAAVGAGAMTLLVQSLLQDRAVSLCAGALYGFGLLSQTRGGALLVLSVLCMWRWLRQENFAPLRRTFLWLLAAILLLAMSAVYCWDVLWLVPLYLICYFIKLVARAKAAAGSGRRATPMWLSILLTVLVTVLGGVVLWSVVAIRLGIVSVEALPAKLLTLDFYRGILQDIPQLARYLTPPFSVGRLKIVRYDWPIFLCGAASLVAVLIGAVKRRDTAGIAILVLCLGLLAAWMAAGAYLMPVGLIPAMAYVWHGLRQRKNTMPAYLCFALCGVYYIIHWCYLYF